MVPFSFLVAAGGPRYEIEIVGVKHIVAFECKDYKKAVEKGKVQEFKAKIDDFNNIIGIMVSSNGYQSGAILYAKEYGITCLTVEELPKINEVLAKMVRFLLPDDTVEGSPFWTIMEVDQNMQNTGIYTSPTASKTICLFYSKKAAEEIIKKCNLIQCKAFGVSRLHLKALKVMCDTQGLKTVIFLDLCSRMQKIELNELLCVSYKIDDIIKEYDI